MPMNEQEREIHKAILHVRDLIRKSLPDDRHEYLLMNISIVDDCMDGQSGYEVTKYGQVRAESYRGFNDPEYFTKEEEK